PLEAVAETSVVVDAPPSPPSRVRLQTRAPTPRTAAATAAPRPSARRRSPSRPVATGPGEAIGATGATASGSSPSGARSAGGGGGTGPLRRLGLGGAGVDGVGGLGVRGGDAARTRSSHDRPAGGAVGVGVDAPVAGPAIPAPARSRAVRLKTSAVGVR